MGGRDSEVDSMDRGGSEVDGGGEVRLYHDREHSALKQSRSSWVPENGEGGRNLGWLWGGDRGSTRLGWRWRLAAMSKLSLEGCNLCCQLGDVLLGGHGGVLARGLQGLSFLLLSGRIQDRERAECPGTCGAPTYL